MTRTNARDCTAEYAQRGSGGGLAKGRITCWSAGLAQTERGWLCLRGYLTIRTRAVGAGEEEEEEEEEEIHSLGWATATLQTPRPLPVL
jgi:hypothetical protein